VPGDSKALVRVSLDRNDVFVASVNRDSLRVFRSSAEGKLFMPQAMDAFLAYKGIDGTRHRQELYYGSGFYSQSGRRVRIPSGATEVSVIDFSGKSRSISDF